jgi:hypothetical protein
MKKLIIPLIFGIIFVLSLYSSTATAVKSISFIDGKIYDKNTNNGINGASVTVTCNGHTKQTTSHGNNGYYLVIFPPSLDCPMESQVTVTAHKDGLGDGSGNGEISLIATLAGGRINIGLAEIDVGIPEFTTMAFPIMLSILSFGIVFSVKKKKTQ